MANSRKAGFALIDALVAVTILSLSLALVLKAADMGRRLSDASAERRSAATILKEVSLVPMTRLGTIEGERDGFSWELKFSRSDQVGRTLNYELCARQAVISSGRSGREWTIASLQPCPIERGP